MSERDGEEMSRALIFILQYGKWLERYCAKVLWGWGYPSYWAEDLAQIVRMRLSAVADEVWEAHPSKRGYVCRTVRNEAIKFCKRKPREEVVDYSVLTAFADSAPGTNPEQMRESAERIMLIWERLNQDQRELFDYFLMNGCEDGYEEIAAKLGITEVAARKRAERLRKRVRHLMKESDASPPTRDEATDNAWDETSLVILADTRD